MKKKNLKKEVKKFWLGYRELLKDGYPNWGIEFENKNQYQERKKHPISDDLQFAFLTKIIDLLREIKEELRREKTIK